ncbi:MAG: HAD family phosphatase [Methylococcaceae bacterium]|nr:HAD family phosphatase [Methylococcaceae bacterium]
MKLVDFSAVIFDMDGLVLDTEATYCFAKQEAAKSMGFAVSDDFWLSLSGLHASDIEQKLFDHLGADFDCSAFNGRAEQIWHAYVKNNGIQIKPGFFALLNFIVEQALPFCLATNSNAVNATNCLKLARLQDIFPVVITRDDVLQGKPEPDIFLKAADRLGVEIKQCLALEDSPTGIQAATRAGAFSVFVPSVLPVDPLALSLCDVMLPDLEQVLQNLRA